MRHFVRRPAALSHRPQLSNVEPQLRDSRGPKGRAGWGRGVSNTTCNQGTAQRHIEPISRQAHSSLCNRPLPPGPYCRLLQQPIPALLQIRQGVQQPQVQRQVLQFLAAGRY